MYRPTPPFPKATVLPSVPSPATARVASLLLALSGVTGCIEEWKGVDGDGDGWSAADGDCWDTPDGPDGSGLSGADIYPGAVETWYDGVDANCDKVDDFDPDGDGWVLEDAHIGQATVGVAGSGQGHVGAGDCYNTPDDAFTVDPLADLDAENVDAALVYPGATDDWYDGIDHDCDGRDDYDADEDGDRSLSDGDGSDCDDADPLRAGIFDELCDPEGIDEDCDELVNGDDDSVDPTTAFEAFDDVDGDGFGDPLVSDVVCDLPDGAVANSDDCDDTRADVNPDAPEVCDPDDVDENCNDLADDADDPTNIAYTSTDVAWADGDGDNYGAGDAINICDPGDELALNDEDCDDTNADISPAAAEVCDGGVDNNCDGLADDDAPDVDLSTGTEFYADTDGDGYGDVSAVTRTCALPDGYSADATDCDDTAAAVNPAATEVCNSIDDNCDGATDDADSAVSYGASDVWWADDDADGYGDSSSTLNACTAPADHVDPDLQPDADCDDGSSAINPGEDEICDAGDTDEDCDGLADDDDPGVLSGGKTTFYDDDDSDGYGDSAVSATQCDAPAGYITDDSDCDDTDSNINPGATEVCDTSGAVDEDCDGLIDDADPSVSGASQTTFYADDDSDTYGDAGTSDQACTAPSGFVADDTDCDDTDAAVNPGASEICNGDVDDDCNGVADDDDSGVDISTFTTFYLDADSDDFGVSGTTTDACSEPAGYAAVDGDCDDAVSTTNPGAAEVCNNSADDDCDAATVCELETDDISLAAEVAWYGEENLDYLGYAVAIVPDVTNDGVADILISAYQSDGTSGGVGATNSGSVYIADSLSGVEVGDTVTETIAFQTQIVGGSNADRLGTGMSGGDFNNDGFGDLVVGAVLAESGIADGISNGGRAYLFLGPITSETLDIGSSDDDDRIGGASDSDYLGWASATGDIDGDSNADLALAAPQCVEASTGSIGSDAGAGIVYVLPGGSGTSWFNRTLGATTGIEFVGETTGDCAGYALLFADTDGSGFEELIIGAPKSVTNSRGTVYIADTSQTGTQLLADERALKGWVNNHDVGTALGKGDFNSDGYDDLLVGSPGVNSDDGVVYVLYGNATLGSTPSAAISTTTADASIIGPSGSKGQVGFSVAGAGDLDNDGNDDIVTGAWRDDTVANNAGAVWVVHGPVSGAFTLDSTSEVQLTGGSAVDSVGFSVAGGHDVNGDGSFTDIVVGAYTAEDSGSNTGAAYVVFGQGE